MSPMKFLIKIMKSYTDIEQSKKLAEILPIESADMWWSKNFIYYNPTAAIGISAEYSNVYTYKFGEDDIPCWSLAALLSVFSLPKLELDEQEDGERGWFVSHYTDDYRYDSYYRDEPIDACYNLILKLKERNLL